MKINFKFIIAAIVLTIALMVEIINSQESYWAKCEVANLIGDFESSEIVEDNGDYQVWIVEQYGENWIIKIEDGHLISKEEL